jgi:hypothetical protein
MKNINLYPGFVQGELVKTAEGENFDHERNKGKAATWCVERWQCPRWYTRVRACVRAFAYTVCVCGFSVLHAFVRACVQACLCLRARACV